MCLHFNRSLSFISIFLYYTARTTRIYKVKFSASDNKNNKWLYGWILCHMYALAFHLFYLFVAQYCDIHPSRAICVYVMCTFRYHFSSMSFHSTSYLVYFYVCFFILNKNNRQPTASSHSSTNQTVIETVKNVCTCTLLSVETAALCVVLPKTHTHFVMLLVLRRC